MDRFAPYPVFGPAPDWQKGKGLGCMQGLQHHDDSSYNKGHHDGYNKGYNDGYLKGKEGYNTAYDEGKGVGYLKGKESLTSASSEKPQRRKRQLSLIHI